MAEFSELHSLGSSPPEDIAQHLMDIGALDDAQYFTGGDVAAQALPWSIQAWKHTGMVIGFIEPGVAAGKVKVLPAATQVADHNLINTRIKVTLDRFYIESYPGGGAHTVVCEFNGKNQVMPEAEALKFATKFQATDQSAAPAINVPVFLGLTVSADGLAFEGRTINVKSGGSEALLDVLESQVFRSGLSLIQTAQPALKPFVSLATATIKTIVSGSKNRQVHQFNLGLDFSNRPTSTCLKLGTYIVAQASADSWDWSAFDWDVNAMILRDNRKSPGESIGFNYTAIGVSPFGAQP